MMDWESNLQEFTRITSTGAQRLLVLLHGFNNTYEEGRTSLTQYMDLMAQAATWMSCLPCYGRATDGQRR